MGEGSPSGGENEEVEEQGEGREGGGAHNRCAEEK